jgi:hypothetical protein
MVIAQSNKVEILCVRSNAVEECGTIKSRLRNMTMVWRVWEVPSRMKAGIIEQRTSFGKYSKTAISSEGSDKSQLPDSGIFQSVSML